MYAVSVVIPVYNGAQYIDQCVASLRSQTLKNIEIIFVDDGSTDQSLNLLRRLETETIQVLHQENAGAGPARNEGIRHASGEYIAFLDVDDKFAEETTLEKLYNNAKQHEAMICGGSFKSDNIEFEKTNKRIFTGKGWIKFKDYQFDFGFQRFIYSTKMLRLKQIQFPAYRIFEDPVFLLHSMHAAKQFYVIPDAVYFYSGAHQTNISCGKAIDYLYGLRDNLKFTADNGYALLHKENFERLQSSASYYAEGQLPTDNRLLFSALIEANAAIDKKLLSGVGIILDENYVLPALETIWRTSNQYISLRKKPLLFVKRIKQKLFM